MDLAQPIQKNLHLSETQWKTVEDSNQHLLEPIVSAHRLRRMKGEKHPIIDFLFDYYHFKPSKLLEWTPGIGVYLKGSKAKDLVVKKGFNENQHGVFIDTHTFPADRMDGLNWTIDLLKQSFDRKPQFNCFGLHEWCMTSGTELKIGA